MRIFKIYSQGWISYILIGLLIIFSGIEAFFSNVTAHAASENGLPVLEAVIGAMAIGFIFGLIFAFWIKIACRKTGSASYIIGCHFFMFLFFYLSTLNVLAYFIVKHYMGIEVLYSPILTPMLLGMRVLYREA